MRKQRVFIVNGVRPIREYESLEIRICEKWTWAVLPSGSKRLLGTTAFFTRKAAEVRKLGELKNAIYAPYHVHPGRWDSANRQLIEYRETGTIH